MNIRRQTALLGVLIVNLIAPLYAGDTNTTSVEAIDFPDLRFTVSGLPWFNEDKPALRRLPLRLKDTFREPVWALAQHTSGGRIRFRTDSTRVNIVANNPSLSPMYHMPSIGQNGFDIYVNGEYLSSAWPDEKGKIVRDWTVGKERALRDITIYLPLYNAVVVHAIGLESNAKVESPTAFAVEKPVVYYGSSITQGGCASNPGMSYQAIVSRWLNIDFVNLGFSGQGHGDIDVAKVMCEIDASCYVLDYWANPSPAVFRDTLPTFVDTLRRKSRRTPILVIGPYYNSAEGVDGSRTEDQAEKRKIAKEFVDKRRDLGDTHITYVDGLEMISRANAIGLVDGRHANSLGFYFCAKGIEPHLRKALGISAPEAR